MPREEGIVLRKGLSIGGAALFVFGLVIYVVFVVAATQATTDFMNCLSGNPGYPLPSACTSAMSAMALYGSLEWVGAAFGLIGFVLLVLGLVLPPERPTVPPSAFYPPPGYPPPGPPP